jgi:hypothetical protein
VTAPGFDPTWLALREPADHAARAGTLLEPLCRALTPGAAAPGPLVVHDLGSGTGSMARWLAPRLPGPQRWVLHDHDPALLAAAVDGCAGLRDAAGDPVPVQTRITDIARLGPADLVDTGSERLLLTASALLDLLTADEVDALAATAAAAGCPALLTLSVAGDVTLDPPDPLDRALAAAFDAHQRRRVGSRRLLGPDAAAAAVDAFGRHGMTTRTAPSRWQLGPDRAALTGRWLQGRVAAAVEQDPALAEAGRRYLERRLEAGCRVVVGHHDLLALPAGRPVRGRPA